MKTTALIAALLCCIVSASAQQFHREHKAQKSLEETLRMVERMNRHDYTMELDSVTNDFVKVIFGYDAHINCTSYALSFFENGWEMREAYEYYYDGQDRLTTKIDIDSKSKEEYLYNAQNLLEEIDCSQMHNGVWGEPSQKTILNYDDDGHVILNVVYFHLDDWKGHSKQTYDYEDGLLQTSTVYWNDPSGEWQPDTFIEYAYDDAGLCIEEITSTWREEWVPRYKIVYHYDGPSLCSEKIKYGMGAEDWVEIEKYTYDYDAAGNLHTEIGFNYSVSQGWIYNEKKRYDYDESNSCTFFGHYEYRNEDWQLLRHYSFVNDPTVSISDISGLPLLLDLLLVKWLDVDIQVRSKIRQFTVFGEDDESYLMDCHYSDVDGVDERNDDKLALWPNPTSGILSLNTEGLLQVEIFSMDGERVMHMENVSGSINVSSLAQGVYLLKAVHADGSKAVRKFVKE